jgi:hypothetical protein
MPPDGEHIIYFGTDAIRCRLETGGDLARSLQQPARQYWVAEYQGRRIVIAPATTFDLADPAQEADFRQLVLERLGLLR